MDIVVICLLGTLFVIQLNSYPTGAPVEQCVDMQPSVYTHGNEQTIGSNYSIKVFPNTTEAGESVFVRVDGDMLKGILLEAREKETNKIIGSFIELLTDRRYKRFQTIDCNGPNSAVTHFNADTKRPPFHFHWTPPLNASGEVEFVATIVRSKLEYWRNIKSNVLFVEELGNCTERDYHLFESCSDHWSFLGTLNNGIFDPEGVCSEVWKSVHSAFKCIENYYLLCEAAGDKAVQSYASTAKSLYEVFRNHTNDTYNAHCDECGYVEANRCFLELTTLDLSDLESSCSAYQRTIDCVASLEETCQPLSRPVLLTSNPKDTQAANESLQANLRQCELYESCPTVLEKKRQLEACFAQEIADPLSFENICIQTESYSDCLVQAGEGCQLLDEQLIKHRSKIRAVMSTFGCMNDEFTPLASDCNLRDLLQCYDPLLEHLFNQSMTTGSLTDLLSELKTYSSNLTGLDRSGTCSTLELTIQNATTCFIREFMKCPFNPALEELDLSIPVEEKPLYALQQLVSVNESTNFNMYAEVTGILQQVTAEVSGLSQQLSVWCEEGCENIVERTSQFKACFKNDTDIEEVVRNVLYHYQHSSTSTTEDCNAISEYIRCADEHLTGCGWTESSIVPHNDVSIYQAIEICDVKANINYREHSACLDEDYSNHLVESIHHSCKDISRKELRDLSSEEVCLLLEERGRCFLNMSPCCGLKKSIVEPRLFTWSIINRWLMCDSVVNYTHFVTDESGECPLEEIFKCYKPLVEFVLFFHPVLKDKNYVYRMSGAQDYYFTKVNRESRCPTESDFQSIETCVAEKSAQCTFPSTCLNQNIAVTAGPVPLPFADFFALKQNKELCSTDCEDQELTEDSLAECDVENIPMYVQTIAGKDVTGLDFQTQCSSLQIVTDCLQTKIGNCSAMKSYIRNHVEMIPFNQAADLCTLDVSFLDPEPMEWDILEYTTTSTTTTTTPLPGPTVIAGANVKVTLSVWLFVGVLLQTFCF